MKIGNLFKGDKVIWMVLLFLCLISVVEVFSASSTLTYKSQDYLGPIIGHSWKMLVGVGVAIVILNVPCRYFKLMTPGLLLISVIMLVWVLFFGEKTNDAGRWISLLGLKFQPSEIAKGTLVLVTAQILSAMQRENGADKRAFKYILVVFIGSIYMLGSLDQEESSETQTEAIVNGEVKKDTKKSASFLHRFGTWKNRIDKKLNSKHVAPADYDLDKDAQVAHANIAIVGSNIIGKGPGKSVERDFLPQAFSDFIYVIIIEELGIIGAAFVAFLYIVLLYRAARIASRCENNFPAFLVMGLALMLVLQASFNMLVAVGIAPVTGQPLPLISRGGTSTIINCAYIGAMLSVSRSAKKRGEKLALKEI